MIAQTATTIGNAFDGPVDGGLERGRPTADAASPPSMPEDVSTEAVAHALLRLIGDHPGQMGRLRAVRLIGGYPVPHRDDEEQISQTRYAVRVDWSLRELTNLADALISGRLIAQTNGPRPVLVLTRAGYRALEALDQPPVRPHP